MEKKKKNKSSCYIIDRYLLKHSPVFFLYEQPNFWGKLFVLFVNGVVARRSFDQLTFMHHMKRDSTWKIQKLQLVFPFRILEIIHVNEIPVSFRPASIQSHSNGVSVHHRNRSIICYSTFAQFPLYRFAACVAYVSIERNAMVVFKPYVKNGRTHAHTHKEHTHLHLESALVGKVGRISSPTAGKKIVAFVNREPLQLICDLNHCSLPFNFGLNGYPVAPRWVCVGINGGRTKWSVSDYY